MEEQRRLAGVSMLHVISNKRKRDLYDVRHIIILDIIHVICENPCIAFPEQQADLCYLLLLLISEGARFHVTIVAIYCIFVSLPNLESKESTSCNTAGNSLIPCF